MAVIAPVDFISKKGKSIHVRSAVKDDGSDVLQAMIEIAETTHFILSTADDFRKKSRTDQEAFLERALLHPKSFFMIAIHNARVIATSDFVGYKDSKRGHRGAFGISVHQDYRGEGIGKRMMEIIIHEASKFPELKFIELDVMEPNLPAFEMYKKFGFEVVHTTPRAYQLSEGNFVSNVMMRFEIKK